MKWYQKAINGGNAYGMSGLACCYEFGYGVKQDYAEALKWYEKALENGREKDEWIINRMKECNSHIQKSKRKGTKKTSQPTDEQALSNLKILKVYGETHYATSLTISYDFRQENCEGKTLKAVHILKPVFGNVVLTQESELKINMDGSTGWGRVTFPGLPALDYESWNVIFCTNELSITSSGIYSYEGNLTIYDENDNTLDSFDYTLNIKYKHKLFGSDEVKAI